MLLLLVFLVVAIELALVLVSQFIDHGVDLGGLLYILGEFVVEVFGEEAEES